MKRKRTANVNLNVRMKEPLRAAIERAAKRRGVSMNAEAVDRLERSFGADDALGGAGTAALARMLAANAALIEAQTGRRTFDDFVTFRAVMLRWAKIVSRLAPNPPDELIRMELELTDERNKGAARDEDRIKRLDEEVQRHHRALDNRAHEIADAGSETWAKMGSALL